MLFCTLCLYLKRENTSHCCKKFYNRNKFYCEQCNTHTKLCKDKQTHKASFLPDAASCDDEGPDQEEQETGQTALAAAVTLEDYGSSDGGEEEY